MSVGENKRIRAKLKDGQDFVEMQNLINKPREIKDECEIKKIAEAEKIGDMAFEYVLGRIKEGVTEREIALDLEFFMKKQGATALSFDTISASGIRSAMPHGIATDKKIENGDFLTLDFGCVFEGYCSDMTRTVVVGKANDKQKEIYNTVLSPTQVNNLYVNGNALLGTSNFQTKNLKAKIYPNPASEYLIVSGLEGNSKLEIYTITGQLVQSQNFNNEVQINLDKK